MPNKRPNFQRKSGAPHLARFLLDVGYHGAHPATPGPITPQDKIRGIPHLAKNERDVGHPTFVGS
jgi:hypothetical protein